MLDGAAFVVLHSTSFVVLVGAHEPAEDLFVAVASAGEKQVLTQCVSLEKRFLFVGVEDGGYYFEVLGFNGEEKRGFAFMIFY